LKILPIVVIKNKYKSNTKNLMAQDSYQTGSMWKYMAVTVWVLGLLSQAFLTSEFCFIFFIGGVVLYLIGLFIED